MRQTSPIQDDVAYPLRLFVGAQQVEVQLLAPLDAKSSRSWLDALHAYAAGNHLRAVETGGVIHVNSAAPCVLDAEGAIVRPEVMPGTGRRLLLWIEAHEAVDRLRFWPWRGGQGYRIVVLGGRRG